ncbi:uncharacterized protein AB9X84_013789 isoform 2-T3 [Acanthopagrus schlegelii]
MGGGGIAFHKAVMGSAVTRRGGLFAFYSLAQPAEYKRKTDLKTALVQGDDFSSGTSSRSTKLIHGGVRYLQKAIMKLDYKQEAVTCLP